MEQQLQPELLDFNSTANLDWTEGSKLLLSLDEIQKGEIYLLFTRDLKNLDKFYNHQIRIAICEELNLEEDYCRFLLRRPDLDTGISEFLILNFLDVNMKEKLQYGLTWFVIKPT